MLRDYFGGNLWPSAFFADPVRVLSIGRNPIQVLLIRSDPVRVLSIRSDPIRSGPGFVNARDLDVKHLRFINRTLAIYKSHIGDL